MALIAQLLCETIMELSLTACAPSPAAYWNYERRFLLVEGDYISGYFFFFFCRRTLVLIQYR